MSTQPIDTRQLRAFVTLAQHGSFTVAAKELGLSQSAVSHSMKALEGDLGCRLFDRMSKKVLLTQAGEQLLTHAHRILREMTCARDSLAQLRRWGQARLRIGASTTACQYILPEVLREFQKQYPNANVVVEPSDTPEALGLLAQQRVDLAISLEPKKTEDMDFVPLFTDEMQFVIAPTHPWAQSGRVNRDDISRQQYVLYNKGSYTFQLVEEYFRAEGVALNLVMQLGSMEAIKEMVKLGLGITVLAPWVARQELANGSLVSLSLGKRKLKRTWGVLYGRSRRLSMAEETFLTICRRATVQLNV